MLPFLGGARVTMPGPPPRRVRVDGHEGLAAGFHRFRVEGRVARSMGIADAPDLRALPAVRGHLVLEAPGRARLVTGGARPEVVSLLPEDEPPILSPVRARRWPSGDLIFEALDFEGEAEETARLTLEEGSTPASAKGMAASLRAALALAVLLAESRRLSIPASVGESWARIAEVAEGGRPAAEQVLRDLELERRAHAPAPAPAPPIEDEIAPPTFVWSSPEENRPDPRRPARSPARRHPPTPEGRVGDALDAAGARLYGVRALARDHLEVRFGIFGERFVAVVERGSLRVVDAGICLAGADRMVTLESLPSVIREAIDTDRLVITRR